jgi:hypothetical protein
MYFRYINYKLWTSMSGFLVYPLRLIHDKLVIDLSKVHNALVIDFWLLVHDLGDVLRICTNNSRTFFSCSFQ